jgi:hypothetical protein
MLWMSAGLVAITAIAGVLVLAAPVAPPYDFLDGHAPIRIEYTPEDIDKMRRLRVTRQVYSFRADYDKLVPIVDAELARHGMKLGSRGGFVKVDPNNERLYIPPLPPPRKLSYAEVSMHRNVRVSPGKGETDWSAEGWVTFGIILDEPPSLLERFRAWLGL